MSERFTIPGAYLTVSQLSTGLKDFWVNFFFRTARLKKDNIFFYVFIFQKRLPRVSSMVCGSSRKGPAVLLHCTSTFKVYRQASQDCARDIIKKRTPQAVYVHCRKAHSLNLAFGYVCEYFLVRNTMISL